MTVQRETDRPFEVVSVRSVEPPPGAAGSDWHRYVISQGGANAINGYRQGTLQAVNSALEEIVVLLNERRMGKRGRVNLVPTPKK